MNILSFFNFKAPVDGKKTMAGSLQSSIGPSIIFFDYDVIFMPRLWDPVLYDTFIRPANISMDRGVRDFDGDAEYDSFIPVHAKKPTNFRQRRLINAYGPAIYQAYYPATDKPRAPELGRDYLTPRVKPQKPQIPKKHSKRRGRHF